MYDFLGDADFYEDRPVSSWGEAEFRSVFESVQRVFGADIAWQLLYRLIQLRAGEIGEVEFSGRGNPLDMMRAAPSAEDAAPDAFNGGIMDGIMDEILDEDAYEELTDEELEELFEEEFDEDDFEDFSDDDDDDDDDYRERYGNAGRFF